MLPTPFQLATPQHRNIRYIIQVVKPFLNDLIFQYTYPLPFEPEAHSIHTLLLVREHLEPYLK